MIRHKFNIEGTIAIVFFWKLRKALNNLSEKIKDRKDDYK